MRVFTTFEVGESVKREMRYCNYDYNVNEARNELVIFVSTTYDEDGNVIMRKYIDELTSAVSVTPPSKATVVFKEEDDQTDWWDTLSNVLCDHVTDLRIVNNYGTGGSIVAPPVPDLRRFARLMRLSVIHNWFAELNPRTMLCDVTTPDQLGSLESIEFYGIDIDVLNRFISDSLPHVKELVLYDGYTALISDMELFVSKFPNLTDITLGLDGDDDQPELIPGELRRIANILPGIERVRVACDSSMESFVTDYMCENENESILDYIVIVPEYEIPSDYDDMFETDYDMP